MFDSSQKSTGTGYTTTVAFLIVALVFIPAALMFFDNYGRVAIAIAIVGSVSCLGMAWRSWKKSSQLTMPSIEPHGAPAK
jgi:membrane associated rhomboid family serine protease